MNSTLPNFPMLPAAVPPTGAPAVPGLESFGIAPTGAGGETIDFAALIGLAPAGAAPVADETVTVDAPNIFSLCLPASEVDAAPAEVPEEVRQEAVAFACVLLQALLPEIIVPTPVAAAPAPVTAPVPAPMAAAVFSTTALPPAAVPSVEGKLSQPVAPATADKSVFIPPTEGAPLTPAKPVTPNLEQASVTGSKPEVDSSTVAGAEVLARALEQFEVSTGADGAIELKLKHPETSSGAASHRAKSDEPFALQATLELPGEAVVRVEASTPRQAPVAQENFAAGKMLASKEPTIASEGGERNFQESDKEELKKDDAEDGTGVAKHELAMTSTTTSEASSAKPAAAAPAPATSEFRVESLGLERATEVSGMPTEQRLAERAVATVTNVVEAQFAASMQKSGSVQLRVQLGGEDLSIRVEMRGGEVHTDFQTDSAELRAAINREWQTVAAHSPEQLRRYIEPVFSSSSSHSFGQDGQSSGSRQQHPQQQTSFQQDFSQQRSSRQHHEEPAPFAHHSLLRDTFFPEPVAPRAPALLPTSLRLSALA